MDKEKTPEGDPSEKEVIDQSENDQVESEDSNEQTKNFDKDAILKIIKCDLYFFEKFNKRFSAFFLLIA